MERGVDDEGHEAEDSPYHEWAMRSRGEEALDLHGVHRVSALLRNIFKIASGAAFHRRRRLTTARPVA
jgi:hypothetical protein